jgi:2-methylisocitrate lyase-like PEP mutase family enzyme
MTASEQFRKYLEDGECYLAPGVYDCIGSRAAYSCGFKMISLTGNGLSAAYLGMPDMGLLTMTEMTDSARRIAASVPIPLIADADNGYGGVLNIDRTVKEFISAGVAAIHLEDQPSPKKCAYYPGEKRILSLEDGVRNIKTAVHARGGNPLCIIARTDAMRSDGLEETVRRANAYAGAGADAVFAIGLSSREEIEKLRAATKIPLFANINDGKALSDFEPKDFKAMGIKCVLYPATVRNAYYKAARDALLELAKKGHTRDTLNSFASIEEFGAMLDSDVYQALEDKFK